MRQVGPALLIALGGVACGPSFQAVYECDVHFEHCYALDRSAASTDLKKECWREWLHGYTDGQPRDRVEYAATRFSELSLDPTLPQEDTARPRVSTRSVVAPVPTNAFAPPPNIIDRHPPPVVTVDPPAPPPPPPAPPEPLAPGAACAQACGQRWSSCRDGCAAAACDRCDRAYRTCVPACFREEPVRPPPKGKT